jgi:hypothetical protein
MIDQGHLRNVLDHYKEDSRELSGRLDEFIKSFWNQNPENLMGCPSSCQQFH